MPTVIDSLIVTLGLDSKDLETKSGGAGKKLKDLESGAKSTEGSVKKLGDTSKSSASSVDSLAKSVGGFLAVLGGATALRAFIEDTIASNAALDRLSKNLNLSVEDLSAWGNAVEQMGGSAKGLQGTMSMLSQAQTELRLTGQNNLIPYFSSLGIAMAGAAGEVRPVNDILLDLAERFSHMDRPTANNMGKMMGIDQDTLNLLLQGRNAVELMIKRQKESNAVTKAQAEESAKLQKQMVALKQNFEAVGRSLLQSAAPAIEGFLRILTNLSNWIQNNSEFIKDLGIILGVVAAGVTAIAIASSPLTLTVAAVVALAAGIALLWQDFQVWKRGGDSLIDWDKWKPGIDAAKAAILDLWDVVKNSFGAIYHEVGAVQKLLHGDWKGAADSAKKSDDAVRAGVHSAFNAVVSGSKIAPAIAGGVANTVSPGAVQHLKGKKTLGESIGQVEGFYAKGAKPNRPQRNHNPGDIEYGDFAKKHGATGSDGRFAIFPDDATGMNALNALLASKNYRNLTLTQAINRFAPPDENNTAGYTASVQRMTGFGGNARVGDVLNGFGGASSTVAAAGAGPTSAPSNQDHSTTVTTGNITINTQATDAPGIAQSLKRSVHFAFAGQANGGMS